MQLQQQRTISLLTHCSLYYHSPSLLTQVCSEVLDKLNPLHLLLPELHMAVLAGSDNEVRPGGKRQHQNQL